MKSLLKLDVFELSLDDLRSLPEEHVAAFSVLSYAVSEANALSAIYIGNSHENHELKHVNSALNISRYLLLRTWSSKFFEAKQFLGDLTGRKPQTKDTTLIAMADVALEKFKNLSAVNGAGVAENIRHEASNHYSFSAAKKNLRHVNEDGDFSFYVHEANGNCFYPLGEEVMFQARLNRRWSSIPKKEDRDRLFLEWLDWNLEANRWLSEVHFDFASELIFKALNRTDFVERADWLDKSLIGNMSELRQPRFNRKVPAT